MLLVHGDADTMQRAKRREGVQQSDSLIRAGSAQDPHVDTTVLRVQQPVEHRHIGELRMLQEQRVFARR